MNPKIAIVTGAGSGIGRATAVGRSEEHTSELQSQSNLVCRLLLEKKKDQHTGIINGIRLKTLTLVMCKISWCPNSVRLIPDVPMTLGFARPKRGYFPPILICSQTR